MACVGGVLLLLPLAWYVQADVEQVLVIENRGAVDSPAVTFSGKDLEILEPTSPAPIPAGGSVRVRLRTACAQALPGSTICNDRTLVLTTPERTASLQMQV